jgi:hypothetical protein
MAAKSQMHRNIIISPTLFQLQTVWTRLFASNNRNLKKFHLERQLFVDL